MAANFRCLRRRRGLPIGPGSDLLKIQAKRPDLHKEMKTLSDRRTKRRNSLCLTKRIKCRVVSFERKRTRISDEGAVQGSRRTR